MLTRMPDGSWLDPARVTEVFRDLEDLTVCIRLVNGLVLEFDCENCNGTQGGVELQDTQDLADEIARRINAALRKEDGE